jgi:hypothetical protein
MTVSKDEGERVLEGPFCLLLEVVEEVEYHHPTWMMITAA